MKSINKRKYKINKFRFIRFIICLLLGIGFITCILMNLFITNNETSTKDEILDIVIEDKIIKYENTEPLKVETLEITEDMHISRIVEKCDNKPKNLDDTYYQYIINIAHNEDIPKEVILAIITTENQNYDSQASYTNTNGTVDMGLCQINSAYVDYYANTYNIENLNPYNVEQAITFVARHMKYLSDYGKNTYNLSEKDSYIFAAGAYNRGLGNEIKYRNMYEYKEKFINNYEKFI